MLGITCVDYTHQRRKSGNCSSHSSSRKGGRDDEPSQSGSASGRHHGRTTQGDRSSCASVDGAALDIDHHLWLAFEQAATENLLSGKLYGTTRKGKDGGGFQEANEVRKVQPGRVCLSAFGRSVLETQRC